MNIGRVRPKNIYQLCREPWYRWLTCSNWWCATRPTEGSCDCKSGPRWLMRLDPSWKVNRLMIKLGIWKQDEFGRML